MDINIKLNPDEALALIQVLEHDILHRDLSQRVIGEIEHVRHEWALNRRKNNAPTLSCVPAEQGGDSNHD